MRGSNKKYVIIGVVILVVIAAAAGTVFWLHSQKKEQIREEEKARKEMKAELEEKEEEVESLEGTYPGPREEEEEADYNSEFGISSDTAEDYARNLNPDKYEYYDSGIGDFAFYYPAELFDKVEKDETPNQNIYGENVERIDFTGSDGSELIFGLSRRTDQSSLLEIVEQIYQLEAGFIQDAEVILNKTWEDYGKLVMTGWHDENYDRTVYDLIRIDNDYVMQMKIIIPTYTDDIDEVRKGYVTECLYRMCEFSGADEGARSFSEYQEAVK